MTDLPKDKFKKCSYNLNKIEPASGREPVSQEEAKNEANGRRRRGRGACKRKKKTTPLFLHTVITLLLGKDVGNKKAQLKKDEWGEKRAFVSASVCGESLGITYTPLRFWYST